MAELQFSVSASSDISWSSGSDSERGDFSSPEEELLYYARNGLAADVQNLLRSCADSDISLNINCKGTCKKNIEKSLRSSNRRGGGGGGGGGGVV